MKHYSDLGSSGSRLAALLRRGSTLAAVIILCSGAIEAGSIFMKNGYIIQGPIVERNEGAIVMGWSNGKVVIHRRFIESISFDQAEEKKLAEDAQFHRVDDEGGPYLLESTPETEVADSLPADVESLIQTIGTDSSSGLKPGAGPGVGVIDASTSASSPATPTATAIPTADEALGERQKSERLGASIRAPRGWSIVPADLAFVLRGPPGADDFQPGLNLVSAPRGGMSAEEYSGFLKEEMGRLLEGFEVVSEGPTEVAGHKGFQVVGRGSRDGRSAWVRQALIVTPTEWWLVSAFLPATGADAMHAAVEESFKTLELPGR